MKNSTLLLLSLLLFATASSIAQPRYKKGKIILINQDSVSGLIDYTTPWKPAVKTSTLKHRKYESKIVDAVLFENGRTLKRHQIEYDDESTRDVLAEPVFDGQISLFSYNGKLYLQHNTSANLVEMKEENYKGLLAFALQEREDLALKSQFTQYKKKTIVKMLEDYHQSADLAYSIPESYGNGVDLDLILFYGFSGRDASLFTLNNNIPNQDNEVTSLPAYGLTADITIPSISRFITYSVTAERVREIFVTTDQDYLSYLFFQPALRSFPLEWKMDVINFSGGLKFQLPRPVITPHAGVGFTKAVLLDQSSNYRSNFWVQDNYIGFYASAGISWDLHPRIRPVFEIRYDRLTAATYTGENTRFIQEFSIRNIQANFGLKVSLF
ncbi:MAG: hypothetical protein WBA74_18620 [Cyclobacteriaceae bacterium]